MGHLALMSFTAGEGTLVSTVRESFVWEVRFELDLLKEERVARGRHPSRV